MRRLVWVSLPPLARGQPKIDFTVLRGLWRFSSGIAFIAILGIIGGQSDKMVLSTAVPLAVYAKYLLANALATAAGVFASMILPTLLPQLIHAVATEAVERVGAPFHRFCQFITLAVVPVSLTVCGFSFEILLFWTRDAAIAQQAAPLASILSVGVVCVTLLQVPFLLQVANGATRSSLIANIVSAIVTFPLVFALTVTFGARGAATAVMLVAVAQLFVVAPIIQHEFLPGHVRRWLIEDAGLPLLVAAATVFALRAVLPSGGDAMTGFAEAMLAGGVTLAATLLSLSHMRREVMRLLVKSG